MRTVIQVAAALGMAVGLVVLVFHQPLGGDKNEAVAETPVTPDYLNSLRSVGFPITVSRAVSAHSYGGWQGDGQSLDAYRYPAQESAALIDALQKKHSEFSWREERAEFVTRYAPWTLLPRELQPESTSSVLLIGRPKQGAPTQEYVVDRSRGTFYSVSNRF